MTKNTVGNLIAVFVGVLVGAILYTWIFSDPPPPQPSTSEIPAEWIAYQQQAQHWKTVADDLADSLNALSVQKGEIEIKLNRSEAKIKEYIKQIEAYKSYPDKGATTVWTAEIDDKVRACDSLSSQLREAYFALAEQRDNILDSLNTFYAALIDAKDGTIADQERFTARTMADLTKCRYEQRRQAEALEKAKKGRKTGWLAAVAAGAAAILTNINF